MGKYSLGASAALAAALIGFTGGTANAQDIRSLALEPTNEQPQPPNPLLITTGAVTFAVPYGFSVFAAAASNLAADKWLYVPVVGPVGDFIQRYTCQSGGCRGNMNNAGMGLALSFVGQVAGVGILIKALIDPPNGYAVPPATADNKLRVHFAPTSYAGGGGLQAYGDF
jgi:hypothetical protein